MSVFLGRYVLLACLLPQVCLAGAASIDPRAESLYQQAVPYLQQANSKLEAVPADMPTASAEDKQQGMLLIDQAGALMRPAMGLLEQAAALQHPVAEYRLALIYVMLYPSEEVKAKACPLLEHSLTQGFAPAALEISSWCLPFTDTPQYQAALHAVEDAMPSYAQYFPQPVVRLECRREQPQGLAMQWGSSSDYQAEIYRLLGDSNRAQRQAFYQKALDINDCYKAKRRMAIAQ